MLLVGRDFVIECGVDGLFCCVVDWEWRVVVWCVCDGSFGRRVCWVENWVSVGIVVEWRLIGMWIVWGFVGFIDCVVGVWLWWWWSVIGFE